MSLYGNENNIKNQTDHTFVHLYTFLGAQHPIYQFDEIVDAFLRLFGI